MIRPALLSLTLCCCLLPACSAKEPLDRLIADLNQPSRREKAIDGLLLQLKQAPETEAGSLRPRVIDALSQAYRQDQARGKIVGALAFLEAPAREVYVPALQDAARGGHYYEAAVRAAQALGELGLRQEVPALVAALAQARKNPPADGGSWLERAIIGSLGTLGDSQAIPALVEVLQGDPARQDFYLNKLAVRALGQLGGAEAAAPLIAALATQSYGLLLYEEGRRALCRIGQLAREPLLAGAGRRGPQGLPAPHASGALRVLADLGATELAARVASLPRPRDPDGYQLAAAETLLRLGQPGGREKLLELLDDGGRPSTVRRRAADLLGWYGQPDSLSAALSASCSGQEPTQQLLCWTVGLAFTRAAGGEGLAQLDALIAHPLTNEATRGYLQQYRPRLALVAECGRDLQCYRQALAGTDWRLTERAVLEAARLGLALPPPDKEQLALELAGRYAAAHAQVRQALLVALERLTAGGDSGASNGKIAQALRAEERPSSEADGDTTESRALCLRRRLTAAAEQEQLAEPARLPARERPKRE